MNKLQVVREGQTMTSREISDLVELRHDNVCRTIQNLAAESIIRPPQIEEVKNDQNQTVKQYRIGKRDTFVIVARLSPEFTARLVDRWQELESKIKNPTLPQDYLSALKALTSEVEENQKLQIQLEHAKPSIEFVEKYVDSTGLKGFRQVCKLLKANEAKFREFLVEKKIMYRLGSEYSASACHIDAGRFEVKAGAADTGHAFNSSKFTPKGVNWIAGEWAKFNLEN